MKLLREMYLVMVAEEEVVTVSMIIMMMTMSIKK
jgi:hypothetical protein